jgi:hypothetical protein
MKYWEIIADNLSKAGWSWGCVSAVDSSGRTIVPIACNMRSRTRSGQSFAKYAESAFTGSDKLQK